MQRWLVAAVMLVTVQCVFAETQDFSIHQQFVAPRALSMGNTFSGVEDYNVLFYNPAGLARLKAGELNMGIQAAASPSILTLSKDVDDASKSPNSESAMIDLINRQYGKNYGLRFPTLDSIWVRPNWGIAFIPADLTVNVGFHQQVGPQVNVTAYQDSTLAYGYARSFMDDALTAGILAKGIYRAYVGRDLIAADLISNSNFFRPGDATEGMTIDADLGVQYVPKIPEEGIFSFLKFAKPTFGAVVRNIADYGFKQNLKLYNKEGGGGEPEKLQRRLDLGSRWDLPSFWVFRPKFMFDVRDIGHRYWTFMKGLHVGADLVWEVSTWLRGNYTIGLSQGYFSAGVGAELGIFRLDLTTYGEELGTVDAKSENRLYMAKMSLSF